MISVRRSTRFITAPITTTSTMRIAPSRQLTASVVGKSTTIATIAAKCSRKNDSHTPNMPVEPSIITLSKRPVWALEWKRNGYAGDDAKDAERRPGRERRPYAAPLQRSARHLGMRKLVDHLAEKKR